MKISGPIFSIAVGIAVFAASILTVAIAALVGGKSYIIASTLMVIYCIVPFFLSFENSKPKAQEIVTISVMVALAVVSRAAFAFAPNFKPMAGIVMITGIALGPSAGFLSGACSALISNFIFGQGPWTPWQMLAFGACSYVFGLLAEKGMIRKQHLALRERTLLSIAGAAFIILVAGPILDTSSLLFIVSSVTPESAIAIYLAGFPVNCIHGAATFATLFLISNPILDKLARLREKYGMFQ